MARNYSLRWRVNDIVVASVLAVACGLIFWVWSNAIYPALTAVLALAPQFAPLAGGGWLLAGVLGGFIIRKPGAALYTELLAAIISGLMGTEYSWMVALSGLIQGIGAEIVFAVLLYRVWNLSSALLAAAVSGFAMGFSEILIYYASEVTGTNAVIYVACSMISGMVFAGLLSWIITKALAKTGVLSSLASGRVQRTRSEIR
ncbi:ECF transporter S component [Rothia amarae]|uniref:ECF transporter S component n=1 Tax=Rothia amarae TaxID=169480 RepID=A0A7H2BIR2_9MICC|nr:ECF transporter S component [Rothia amarae]QNV39558.1 ECF transporter S component [Rothia amarae]